MDVVNLVYYALVCALLAWASPQVRSLAIRVVIGAAVGLVAASLLPYLKSLAG